MFEIATIERPVIPQRLILLRARAPANTLEIRSIIWPFRAFIRDIFSGPLRHPPPGTVFPLPPFFSRIQ